MHTSPVLLHYDRGSALGPGVSDRTIKTPLKKIWFMVADWIKLAYDRIQWQFADTVTSLEVPQKVREFMTI
jgi:hypothetical protein